MTLKRAGLPADASTKEIKQLLNYNGISTRGLLERKDLISTMKDVLPPMTREEKFELEQEALMDDPSLLQEREYKFSLAPDGYRFFAAGLGVVNLGGALYLGNLLSQYALYGVQLPSYFGVVQAGYPLLLGYAILFNVVPLARRFWIGARNKEIAERNSNRRRWRERLVARGGSVGRKLKAAATFGTRRKQLQADDVVYDTKQSTEQLKAQRDQTDLDAFDKLLSDGDKDNTGSGGGGVFQ
uniref:Uncharacterized protein n=1 Tax=Craspedostauros australis TaxID=1486917 RepID=A0A7R9ZR68_9STRA